MEPLSRDDKNEYVLIAMIFIYGIRIIKQQKKVMPNTSNDIPATKSEICSILLVNYWSTPKRKSLRKVFKERIAVALYRTQYDEY
jgi:hypothetical protein